MFCSVLNLSWTAATVTPALYTFSEFRCREEVETSFLMSHDFLSHFFFSACKKKRYKKPRKSKWSTGVINKTKKRKLADPASSSCSSMSQSGPEETAAPSSSTLSESSDPETGALNGGHLTNGYDPGGSATRRLSLRQQTSQTGNGVWSGRLGLYVQDFGPLTAEQSVNRFLLLNRIQQVRASRWEAPGIEPSC